MPTGYTLYIRDGKITTGKDFLKLCLRSFSICMEMRDEPLSSSIPVRFEVNPYYQKRYLEAVEERNEFRLMSFDKVRENLIEKHKEEMESIKESLDKCNAEGCSGSP